MSGNRLRSPAPLRLLSADTSLRAPLPPIERAYAALMQWFERHLGSAAK